MIEGAFQVLDDFEAVAASTDAMKGRQLAQDEQHAFAKAAMALRYEPAAESRSMAPITAEQLIEARRVDDVDPSLWTTFQRVQ